MSTRVEVDPLRVNCPTCYARPGDVCVVMVPDKATGIRIAQPARTFIGRYHMARRIKAMRGWV